MVDPARQRQGHGIRLVQELTALAARADGRVPPGPPRQHDRLGCYARAGYERMTREEEAEFNAGQPATYAWLRAADSSSELRLAVKARADSRPRSSTVSAGRAPVRHGGSAQPYPVDTPHLTDLAFLNDSGLVAGPLTQGSQLAGGGARRGDGRSRPYSSPLTPPLLWATLSRTPPRWTCSVVSVR